MAELLVRRVDKVNARDVYLNAALTKRGDVIVVREDDWPWGKQELANPDWMILQIPSIDPSAFAALLAEEPETDPKQPSRTLQRRAFRLDLDHPDVEKAGLDAFVDDLAVEPIVPKAGTTLEEIAVSEDVVSKIEEIVDVVDGKPVFETRDETRAVVSYDVADLHVDTVAKLPASVVKVGPTIRAQCVAVVSPDLITAITTRKDPIPDPAVIGESPAIF